MAEPIDPIVFELFKNAIFSIADEMALTVFRTTYSGVLKDNMDYSTGFADADGKLVAQGLTLPVHLGSVPTAMESIMRHYRDDMVEGDVFIMNDPFDGGMHLPDIFVFKPLYHEGERLAFACTVCHHIDVGGRVAGSNASDSTEIYAEGLRIAPLKLYEAGKKLKAKDHPFGFELGHGFGDNHGWLYPLLWSYGGAEVAPDGKTVVIDSDETARAVRAVGAAGVGGA